MRLAVAALISVLACSAHCEQIPTIAITFDHYRTTYDVAFPIMKKYGLVGTFYVDPQFIDAKDGPTSAELREMQNAGWEIGVYSGFPLDRYLAQGDDVARKFIAGIYFKMLTKGFAVKSFAPSGRLWSAKLAGMASPFFDTVRYGGTRPSLSAADTQDTLRSAVSAMVAQERPQPIVVHKVSDDSDPNFSVGVAAFESLCAALASERDGGRIKIETFSKWVR